MHTTHVDEHQGMHYIPISNHAAWDGVKRSTTRPARPSAERHLTGSAPPSGSSESSEIYRYHSASFRVCTRLALDLATSVRIPSMNISTTASALQDLTKTK